MKASELINTAPSIKVYLDMDGVLADFFAGYQRINPVRSPGDIPPAKEDPTLGKLVCTNFYYTLPKYSTADALVNLVLQYVDHYNICSSPLRGDNENSELWKRKWIGMHLSPKPMDIVITGTKERYAVQANGTPNVLIDDKLTNINRWNAAGGIGLLYDANTNTPADLKPLLDRIFN